MLHRAPRGAEKKEKVHVTIEPQSAKWLADQAHEQERSISWVVNDLVKREIGRKGRRLP